MKTNQCGFCNGTGKGYHNSKCRACGGSGTLAPAQFKKVQQQTEALMLGRMPAEEGASGQDRESYSDTQDRDSYAAHPDQDDTPEALRALAASIGDERDEVLMSAANEVETLRAQRAELLDALRELSAQVEQFERVSTFTKEANDKARAAIAKAEGR